MLLFKVCTSVNIRKSVFLKWSCLSMCAGLCVCVRERALVQWGSALFVLRPCVSDCPPICLSRCVWSRKWGARHADSCPNVRLAADNRKSRVYRPHSLFTWLKSRFRNHWRVRPEPGSPKLNRKPIYVCYDSLLGDWTYSDIDITLTLRR